MQRQRFSMGRIRREPGKKSILLLRRQAAIMFCQPLGGVVLDLALARRFARRSLHVQLTGGFVAG
jgi:hypothetical protein